MYLTLSLLGIFVSTILFYIRYKYSYWKKKNVAYMTPIFPLGNAPLVLSKGIAPGNRSTEYYNYFRKNGHRLGGLYFGVEPVLIITDPQYAQQILKSDFGHFIDRGVYFNKNAPMTVNILTQPGNEWRVARNKFSAMFTTSKLRFILEVLKQCSIDFKSYLRKQADSNIYVNIIEALSCYNTDNIGSVILGLQANSFKPEDASFRDIGRDIFYEFTFLDKLRMYLCNYYSDLARSLNISNIQNHVTRYFQSLMKDTLTYRKDNDVHRKDFVQLLIELQDKHQISLEEMAAQTFLFFTAGFETSSNTASLLLLELGLNPEVQEEIRSEIKTVSKKYNGEITYESLSEMNLLSQAMDETLRKYPPVSTLTRKCVKDYTFQNENVTISKGTLVLIPALAFHRDPEYFPDPMKWDITRFNNKEVKHLGYFPFGDGPRNCVGLQMGKMQVKMGVISVLDEFRVTVDPTLKLPLKLEKDTFVTQPSAKILLKLHKIQ